MFEAEKVATGVGPFHKSCYRCSNQFPNFPALDVPFKFSKFKPSRCVECQVYLSQKSCNGGPDGEIYCTVCYQVLQSSQPKQGIVSSVRSTLQYDAPLDCWSAAVIPTPRQTVAFSYFCSITAKNSHCNTIAATESNSHSSGNNYNMTSHFLRVSSLLLSGHF